MTRKVRHGAFFTGQYRNLLHEYGYALHDIDVRIKTCWKQLFEDSPDTRIYYEVEKDMGYLLDTGNLDVRTEGMSYGMMMAVQMDRHDRMSSIGFGLTHFFAF